MAFRYSLNSEWENSSDGRKSLIRFHGAPLSSMGEDLETLRSEPTFRPSRPEMESAPGVLDVS